MFLFLSNGTEGTALPSSIGPGGNIWGRFGGSSRTRSSTAPPAMNPQMNQNAEAMAQALRAGGVGRSAPAQRWRERHEAAVAAAPCPLFCTPARLENSLQEEALLEVIVVNIVMPFRAKGQTNAERQRRYRAKRREAAVTPIVPAPGRNGVTVDT